MDLNLLIFPSPSPTYTQNHQSLIYIPRKFINSPVQSRKNSKENEQIRNQIEQNLQSEGDLRHSTNSSTSSSASEDSNTQSQILKEDVKQDKTVESKGITDFLFSSNKKEIENNDKIEQQIPCFYLPYKEGSNKLLVYFHGNAEDLGKADDFINNISKQLKINALIVEYPGYGIYKGESNEEQILQDALIVYDFINKELKIDEDNVFLLGRSIGSGPAIHVASQRNPGACILISPYTSIRNVVKDLVGDYLKYLIAERFMNINKIQDVTCPTFFIHGRKDQLIPYQHSYDLIDKCQGVTMFHLSEQMNHNEFNYLFDIILPIKKFLNQQEITIENNQSLANQIPWENYRVNKPPSTIKSFTVGF